MFLKRENMYIPQLKFPVETYLADSSLFNPLATETTAVTTALFVLACGYLTKT